MVKVLMICHGNICRSTMAEFVLKDMVKKQGLSGDFLIESAGTSNDEIGNDTHYGTKNKLDEMKIHYTKRKARRVTKADYNEFDYLICMDQNNVRNLMRIISNDPMGKVSLLLGYTGIAGDIADPWYTGNFDKTYDDVINGCTAFLKQIS